MTLHLNVYCIVSSVFRGTGNCGTSIMSMKIGLKIVKTRVTTKINITIVFAVF